MTHQEKLAFIREAAIKANPTKMWEWERSTGSECMGDYGATEKVIESVTLADVLLTIDKVHPNILVVVRNGEMTQIVNQLADLLTLWKWEILTLEDQDEPTISFIHSLLCESYVP